MILLILLLTVHAFSQGISKNLTAQELHTKAEEYDKFNYKHHQPFYGGQVGVVFKDKSYTTPIYYQDFGDSCIWTGVYLGSQAFRYSITKSPEAFQNVKKAVNHLAGLLHVTYTEGYIARYWGPQNPIIYNEQECMKNTRCHKVNDGPYKGNYWIGGTTKDQYSGWFFGMSLAYDLVHDNEIREIIRKCVIEVVDKLIKNKWIILDEKGKYTVLSAGERPTAVYQISWLLIAFDVSGDHKYIEEANSRVGYFDLLKMKILSVSEFSNLYMQYYGHNLAHTTWYNLLRLGKIYLPKTSYEKLKEIFTNNIHDRVKLTHNAWFNAIFMTQGNYDSAKQPEFLMQLRQDLQDFRAAPNFMYHLPNRDSSTYTLDPVTSWIKYFPQLQSILRLIKFSIKPQASKAFPIKLQCSSDFIFQRSPFEIYECGYDAPMITEPGIDYLASYWLSVYHGLIKIDE